jgi:hypothetical protein
MGERVSVEGRVGERGCAREGVREHGRKEGNRE